MSAAAAGAEPAPRASLPATLPPAVVPFPVARHYRILPDLVRLGHRPEHVDDPGPASLLRLDDGAPRALAHALRELAEEPSAVRWAEQAAPPAVWWALASGIAAALAAEGDPRVRPPGPARGSEASLGPDAAPTVDGALGFPWLGLRVAPDGKLRRCAPDPTTPASLAALAPAAADALECLPAATRALDALRLAIAEDLVVLRRERPGDGGRAAYLLVASPSGWDPGGRGGASFAALHEPVPHGGPLRAAAGALVDAMTTKGPFIRYVWSLAADDAPSHHPRRHPAAPLPPDPGAWWLRVERQTTLPLPAQAASAFFIRVLHAPLRSALTTPARRASLTAAVRSMDASLLAYKGLTGRADALLAWLEAG